MSVVAPLVLRIEPVIHLTEDEFYRLCVLNRDLRIERTARGEIVIMSPAGSRSGMRNSEITIQLGVWARADGTGRTFDSRAGFTLPSGAVRAPDAAWIPNNRLEQLTPEQFDKFAPICPDFVVELVSSSDTLSEAQAKMQEYIANGSRLGWLIEPESRRVFVYRPGAAPEELENPATVSGDPVLPGFVMDLSRVW